MAQKPTHLNLGDATQFYFVSEFVIDDLDTRIYRCYLDNTFWREREFKGLKDPIIDRVEKITTYREVWSVYDNYCEPCAIELFGPITASYLRHTVYCVKCKTNEEKENKERI